MRQEVEIEYKNLLTQKEFEQLKSAYFKKETQPIVQENFYFDAEDFTLKENKCALRIRLKDNKAEMTLKTPFDGHHTETTLDLNYEMAKTMIHARSFQLPQAIRTVLKEEKISIDNTVSLIADLKTERLEAIYPHTIIVLDKSYYSKQVDYELEIESDSKVVGSELFSQILKEHAIPVRTTTNKIARAFNALS